MVPHTAGQHISPVFHHMEVLPTGAVLGPVTDRWLDQLVKEAVKVLGDSRLLVSLWEPVALQQKKLLRVLHFT